MDQDIQFPVRVIRPLLRKFWLVVMMGLAGLACSLVLTAYCMPLFYRADALLFVWPTQASRSNTLLTAADLNLISQMVSDFKVLVKSRTVSRQVAEQLGIDPAQAADLSRHISVETTANTRHLLIVAFHKDPVIAAMAANAVGQAFSQLVASRLTSVEVQVIDPAIASDYPVAPDRMKIGLLGGGIGSILAMLLVLILDSLDKRIRSAHDAQETAGLLLIGTVPDFSRIPVPVNGRQADNPITEAFAAIRTQIEFSDPDHPVQSLVVTCSGPREGKTATAAYLAIAYARMGRRVLLIDADMRRPALHRIFGGNNQRGLADCLGGTGPCRDMIVATAVDRLDFLAAGLAQANPADLLMTTSMTHLLKSVKAEYGQVIIDCPPASLVTDAAIVAAKTDAAVLVVKAGTGQKPHLRLAIESLNQAGIRMLGLIVNNVPAPNHAAAYFQRV